MNPRFLPMMLSLGALSVGLAAAATGAPAAASTAETPKTSEAFFSVVYVPASCTEPRCTVPAKKATIRVMTAGGRDLYRLTTNRRGITRTVVFPLQPVVIYARPIAFAGHHWTALRFKARAPWAGTSPVRFVVRFCLSTTSTC